MALCLHESCGIEDRVWLPEDNFVASDILLHPWCIHCGQVKNISDDRSKKQGYWMNILSKFCNRYNVTKVQKRLIVKEIMHDGEFLDMYGTTGSAQKTFFIDIVRKHTRTPSKEIEAFIC